MIHFLKSTMNTRQKSFLALLFIMTFINSCEGTESDDLQYEREFNGTDSQRVYRPPTKRTNVIFNIEYKVYYAILNETLSWYQAYEYCRRHGTQLASPTRLEYRALKHAIEDKGLVIQSYQGLWISLHDIHKSNNYSWMSTGRTLSENYYSDWLPNEPNHLTFSSKDDPSCNGVEHCVEIRWDENGRRGWNDVRCCLVSNFLCES